MKKLIYAALLIFALSDCNNPAVEQREMKMGVSLYPNQTLIDSLNKEATKPVFNWNDSKGRVIILKETGANEMWYPNGIPGALPGDVYIIPAKHYTLIEIRKTKGTREAPITFRNDSKGAVVADAMRIKDGNEWLRFQGNGCDSVKYGFKTVVALEIFKYIEISNFEFPGSYIGMFVRQVPDSTDRRTYYIKGASDNYTWQGLWVHDSWAHDNDGEAFYIMSTSSEGNTYAGKFMIPARGDSVVIERNLVENPTWDGIQCANTGWTWIRYNTVKNFGKKNLPVQQAGGIMGNGAHGYIYGNSFINGTGNGIQLLSNGLIYCAYNTVDSTGRDGTTTGQHSVLANDLVNTVDAWTSPQKVVMFRNVIKNPQPYGALKLYAGNNNSLPAIIDSNQFYIPGAGTDWASKYVFNNVSGSSFAGNSLNGATAPPPTAPAVAITVSGSLMSRTLSIPYTITGTGITKREFQFSKDGVTWETTGSLKPVTVATNSGTLPYGTNLTTIYVRMAVTTATGVTYSSTQKL